MKNDNLLVNCDCDNYKYGDESSLRKKYWKEYKHVFMGTLLKCECCGSLWLYTVGGHGEGIYVKTKESDCLPEPSEKSEFKEIDAAYFTKELKAEWDDIIKDMSEASSMTIRNKQIPEDIVRFLKFVFKEEVSIRKWLNCPCIIDSQQVIPIKALDQCGGEDILRYYIISYYKIKKLYNI